MMLLCLFNTINTMYQMVYFFIEVTEMSPKNSAIGSHYTNRSCGIDTKIHSKYGLFINICIAKFSFLLKRKIQKPLFPHVFEVLERIAFSLNNGD